MNTYKTIGIIGGQGPNSTADFYLHLIQYYQDHFNATYVRDYPPMIIYSVPTPDLVERIEDEEKTFSMVSEAIIKLERDGADFIVIVCNSLQYLNERLQKLVNIPIISLAAVIAQYVQSKGYTQLGMLATETTINKRVYQARLDEKGITAIVPNQTDQRMIAEVILNEMGGISTDIDKTNMKRIVTHLQKAGANAILLACTELPLILKQSDCSIPIIDCNEIYARHTAQLSITHP